MFGKKEKLPGKSYDPTILIVEDDVDQKDLLVGFAESELKKILNDKKINDQQKQKIRKIKIISVKDIDSLQLAVSIHKKVVLATLDCNIPDVKGGAANDQFIKKNHVITGRHKSIDILIEHSPNTPITMISSLDRFKRIVTKYYKNKYNLDINFIRKKEALIIQGNIRYYLRQYMEE